MSTNPHSAGNKPGSYADHVERPDAQWGGIGKPFAPMIQTAPINHMTKPFFVTQCPECNAYIKWHHSGGDGECANCKTALTTHPETGFPVARLSDRWR